MTGTCVGGVREVRARAVDRVPRSTAGSQLVGLMMKLWPVDVDADVADVHDDPFDDVRDRIGARGVDFDLRGVRIDLQREADHDRAEIERADLRAR